MTSFYLMAAVGKCTLRLGLSTDIHQNHFLDEPLHQRDGSIYLLNPSAFIVMLI